MTGTQAASVRSGLQWQAFLRRILHVKEIRRPSPTNGTEAQASIGLPILDMNQLLGGNPNHVKTALLGDATSLLAEPRKQRKAGEVKYVPKQRLPTSPTFKNTL